MVVVGAGLAGLMAARALVDGGADVIVLEAQDRVGGRLLSEQVGDAIMDLGGQWLAPDQRRAWRLVHDFGLTTFPTYHEGAKVLQLGRKRSQYRGVIPRVNPLALAQLQLALLRIDWLRKRISLEAPWTGARAARLDARSVADLQRTIPSKAARALVDVSVRAVFGVETHELSLLHFLFYAHAGGGLMRLLEVEVGAQHTRLVGGAQQLAAGLARELGDRVRLSTPVRRIDHGDDGVVAHTDDARFAADRCVIAVPPALVAELAFDPPLPQTRAPLGTTGRTIKCILTYERAHWREAGQSGELVATDGPVCFTYDNGGPRGGQPAIVAFLEGDAARAWSRTSTRARRRAVEDELVRGFGSWARASTGYVEKDWTVDPWARGCPVHALAPGGVLALGPLVRAPVGRLHFAGTETATEWCGYMEGALESGERAAAEILATQAASAAPRSEDVP